ncbi:hypothetical protein [Nocardioides solisilvae]|uniref:hypothetical protein n=1 Tax=Nocardioides solisilvae TaxID=1542435 RepID=UPI0013A57AE9|nr:hypothetical protein [Nocardioides solisilvae]
MADRPTSEERPVLTGLIALGGVALVVGVLAGVMVLVGTKMLGLGGGDGDSTAAATSGETLTLPEFSETAGPSGPQITLDPNGPTPTGTAPALPQESVSETPEPEKAITLTAGQSAVGAMQQIDLAGTYAQGGGAILQVQRFENGQWNDFPVTVSVTGESFGTYVMTGQTGENKFRVVDSESGLESNEVVVQVG